MVDHSRPYQLHRIAERRIRKRLGIGIQFLLRPDQGDAQMLSQGIIHVDPGVATARHVHRYSGETFYGLEGEGEIEIAGEIVPCCAHEHIVWIPPGVPHAPRNPSPDTVFRAMFVHTPAIVNGDTYLVDERGERIEGEKE
jgi:mannose-6-phosphate isomerase-like protein (cupin superfamily)